MQASTYVHITYTLNLFQLCYITRYSSKQFDVRCGSLRESPHLLRLEKVLSGCLVAWAIWPHVWHHSCGCPKEMAVPEVNF